MNKLRKKVFWALYGSVALIIFIVLIVYNLSNYFNTRAMLRDAMTAPFVDPRYKNFIIQGFLNNLFISFFVFVLIAVALYFIVKIITDWIVKPAEESFFKQKDFIADASHELKTPLSVITASADAMNANSKNKKYLDNIKEESSRMNTLITKMLDLASTEKQTSENFIDSNLSKTIELAALTFEARALTCDCKLKLDIQCDIRFKYSEDDIKQLVEILLDNALEHSNKNATVELSLQDESGKIILKVTNEGEGIAPGDEEKIFERFYRADKSRTGESSRYGLGLAIAKNIVQNHKGEISANSANGKTTFKVIL